MRAFSFLVALVFVSPAFAQYNCEQVRSFVAANGAAQARAQARAGGMTAEQEREAHKCFHRSHRLTPNRFNPKRRRQAAV